MIDLKQEIVTEDGQKFFIESILMNPLDNTTPRVAPFSHFTERYSEYIDPKDIEIARLKKELAKYRPKKTRRLLNNGERKEIVELILKGETNRPIAQEYQVSETVISKMRVQMRKQGEDV